MLGIALIVGAPWIFHGCWKIIKQLLEKQFGLVDRSNPLLDITIPYLHFNQLISYKKDDELYLEFEKPANKKELEVIKERILALPLFHNNKKKMLNSLSLKHLSQLLDSIFSSENHFLLY